MTWENFKSIMAFIFVVTCIGSCTYALSEGEKQTNAEFARVAAMFQMRLDSGECKPFQQRADGYTTMFICGDIQVPRPRRL